MEMTNELRIDMFGRVLVNGGRTNGRGETTAASAVVGFARLPPPSPSKENRGKFRVSPPELKAVRRICRNLPSFTDFFFWGGGRGLLGPYAPRGLLVA